MDAEHQLIVGTSVTASRSDQGQLVPMLDQVEATVDTRPAQVLADWPTAQPRQGSRRNDRPGRTR